MNASVLKYAPTAVVLLGSGACTWPYLGSLAPAATSRPAPPHASATSKAGAVTKAEPTTASLDLSDALLHPEPSTHPDRNPFQDPERVRAAVRARIVRTVTGWFPAPVTAKRAAKGAIQKQLAGKTRGAAPKSGSADPRSGLVLNATTAAGDRGFAVINGKSFGVGDAVPTADPARPCLLVEVRAHEVQLLHDGRRWPLGYATARASSRGGTGSGRANDLALNTDENSPSPAASKGAPARRIAGRRRGASGK